jgi:hypothetical protein
MLWRTRQCSQLDSALAIADDGHISMASCSLTELRKQQLIHNDVVRINLIRSQLLYKPLRLVQ